ncbi:DNA phosphorothioation-dependent restriction protein DptG [Photobacterium gaetbulicola]|uniref:Dnd system-associated protein 1 n=1 Tax=Photobacterium gaetbulicola Gung47 TaxID=658445 RepID=A0A0C5WRL8_9GAMM|nr:DNA phosphorothioation-dependent restriction protein DptG [Photobacterium gaetbulicola]AJR09783.1 dnd system-associated protein 1 [Photobacterium gaetbulicola Gung47]PSU12301.1 DNA phosphorothioation-dependent restriction protein DptG [Photobacterium gaetbulicola]
MTLDNYKQPFNPNLPQTADRVPNKNSLNSYLPIRTKGNDFKWNAVIGLVLCGLLRKKIESYSYEEFTGDCRDAFLEKLGDEEFWDVLKEMYFDGNDIFSVSPELLLFRAQKDQLDAGDSRIASMFINLLRGLRISEFDEQLNFIEREMLQTLRAKMKDDFSTQASEEPYLPYLSKAFREDLKFLTSRPKYLLNEIESFLSFYGFTYTAQLSLALTDWRSGEEPIAKPLYFIMDHERASNERIHVKDHGYKLFSESATRLFPMLTMLELLQPQYGEKNAIKVPLWAISKDVQDSKLDNLTMELANFARAFKSQRNLNTPLEESESSLDWLTNIMKLAMAQFSFGERFNINKKYVAEVEKTLASHFIQNRRRGGRVLVLNQDYLILLTNLAVGERDKLRFHELIAAFKLRGIFVDKQTEQELIKFYERIGNVERMSDSGDAVYVRRTIR